MNQVPCLQHQGQYILFFLPQSETTQYLCDICLLSLQEQQNLQKFLKLIHINKALKQPEYLISKLDIDKQILDYFIEQNNLDENLLNKELKEIEQKISEMQTNLTKLSQELKLFTQQFQELKQKIRGNLDKIVKFDLFKEIIGNLNQLGDTINPQAIEKSQQNLHQYINSLIQNNSAQLNEQLFSVLNQRQNQVKDLKEQRFSEFHKLEKIYQQVSEQICNLNKQMDLKFYVIIKSNLLQQSYQSKIQNTIQGKIGKKITSAQLIYLGTKEGLNGQIFLTKVNGKSNLLLVFKSSTGAIFGAYTPCKWIKIDQNYQYIQDDSCSSFIFSQNHDQIYSLKQERKQYAICCHKDYPIAFGDGHDLRINSDFKTGYSSLGNSYKLDHSQNSNSTNLFGQAEPNILECEVFELILI